MNEMLERYIPLKGNIPSATDEYEALQTQIFSLTQTLSADRVSTGQQRDKMERAVVALSMFGQTMLEEIREMTEARQEIKDVVTGVERENFKLGTVLRRVYIYGDTHAEIGESMGYVADYVKELKRSALELAAELYDENRGAK